MSLQPGDTLLNGQYRIGRLLGRGGFGFVYLAEDTLLREEVALKELIPALVGDETLLKRFLAEAKATMRLRHERIVATHNVFSERGNYYIVMEYLAGGSLEARLAERGALPVDEALHVATDVAEGLVYAHGLGVVHCDLKPANVLFTADGHAKIADFGIAHVPREMFSRSWATASGFVAGTLPYMSPEQADGVRDDPRADLYALGAVLYRMLTGRPYLDFDQRETPGAQARNVQRIQAEPPQPPSVNNRRVPAWLDAVVLRALAKRPEDRYANAGELLAALARKAAAPIPAPAEPETVVVPPQPRPQPRPQPQPQPRPRPQPLPRWLWPAIGGTAVLLVVVVIVLIASIPRDGGKPTATATRPAVAQATVVPSVTIKPPTAAFQPTATIAPTATPRPTATPAPAAATPTVPPAEMPTLTVSTIPTVKIPPRFTVKEPTINVRDGPDTVYQVIGVLRQGETFEITGKNAAGDWWQFTYNGKLVWVNGTLVNANRSATDVPVAEVPPTPTVKIQVTATPTCIPFGRVTLEEPIDDFTTHSKATFRWDYDGQMGTGYYFQLVAWRIQRDQEDRSGLIDLARTWEVFPVGIDLSPYLQSGTQYKWDVIIVGPNNCMSQLGAGRKIRYEEPPPPPTRPLK